MKALAYLNKFLWKYRGRLFLGFVFILASNIIQAIMPTIVQEAVDQFKLFIEQYATVESKEVFYKEKIIPFAAYVILMYLGLAVLRAIFVFMMRQTIIIVSRLIEYDLKNDVYDQYQRLSLSFYKKNNTGDLMKVVDVGFAFGQRHYQFVDRVGDTFRWNSENVSTNEVGEIINQHEDIIFTNVYGIEIPGTDGRAGMAAIVLKEQINAQNINLESLSEHIRENLPSYARPIFIRLLAELPTTTTHKLQKNDLRDQAFHFDKVSDHMFVMRPGETIYSKLDSDFYDKIVQREVHF